MRVIVQTVRLSRRLKVSPVRDKNMLQNPVRLAVGKVKYCFFLLSIFP